MELREMYTFTEECRKDFEKALQIKNQRKRERMLGKMIMASIEECGSAFEEQTLIEVFRETYQNYIQAIPA